MARRIRGISTEREEAGESTVDTRPLVTLIAPGSNAVELALELAVGCPDFQYQLFSPSVSVPQGTTLKQLRIRYTTDLEFALWHFSTPNAALSFGLLPHPNHLAGAVLTSLLQEAESRCSMCSMDSSNGG